MSNEIETQSWNSRNEGTVKVAEGSNNEFKNLQENEGKSVLLKSWKAEAPKPSRFYLAWKTITFKR